MEGDGLAELRAAGGGQTVAGGGDAGENGAPGRRGSGEEVEEEKYTLRGLRRLFLRVVEADS